MKRLKSNMDTKYSVFTDFGLKKDSKIGITNLFGNITQKEHSHKGGWAKLLKCQLINAGYNKVTVLSKKHVLIDFDAIIFDLGAEFSGSLNLFGGLDEKTFNRMVELYQFQGKLFSWQHDLPPILSLEKRRENKSTCQQFKDSDEDFLVFLQSVLNDCQTFYSIEDKNHLLIGDSHTPSVWSPNMEIFRKDGRTLWGTLDKKELRKHAEMQPEEITCYMGNIDIRHHIFRRGCAKTAIVDLTSEYARQLKTEFPDTKINVASLLPIEHISRKIPKTGFYKGDPFAGTWEQRTAAVTAFNKIMKLECERNGWNFIEFPDFFKTVNGELDFAVMERPQSVHISPAFYRWDLDKNKRRW